MRNRPVTVLLVALLLAVAAACAKEQADAIERGRFDASAEAQPDRMLMG